MAHSLSLTRGPKDRGAWPQSGEVAPGAWLGLAALGGAAATGQSSWSAVLSTSASPTDCSR